MRYVGWLAFAACHGSAPVPTAPPEPTGPSPEAIIAEMERAYRIAHTYVDHGEVVMKVGDQETAPAIGDPKPFSIAFVRTGGFRFEIRLHPPENYVVWSDGVQTFTVRSGAEPQFARDVAAGIVAATGISSGSAHTTPRMLLPDQIPGFALSQLEKPRRHDIDLVDGHECWKITGSHDGDPVTIWVDERTHLLRRIAEREELAPDESRPSFEVVEVTTYDPVVDGEVAPELLKKP